MNDTQYLNNNWINTNDSKHDLNNVQTHNRASNVTLENFVDFRNSITSNSNLMNKDAIVRNDNRISIEASSKLFNVNVNNNSTFQSNPNNNIISMNYDSRVNLKTSLI